MAIHFNLATPDGWHKAIPSREYADIINEMDTLLGNKDCIKLNHNLNYLNTTHVITYNQHCLSLEECGLIEIYRKNNVCLFIVPLVEI